MKIGLIGYGKMGKAIHNLILEQKMAHEVVLKVDSSNADKLSPELLQAADVLIEFSRPESAFSNIMMAIEAGVPIVVGTTAWQQKLREVTDYCEERNGSLLHAPNFSIGVNLFFTLNEKLARMMSRFTQYKPSIEETHHTAKLDAPSGTAIHLAEGVLDQLPDYQVWSLDAASDELPITAHRVEGVPGTHIVSYDSPIDRIDIAHTAHNRKGFAAGAILAAEWLPGKKGVFTMKDVLRADT